MASALDGFSDTTREWFLGAFGSATPAQEGAWRAIAGGDSTLVVAPTGSGKTLAAFLWALDRLSQVDSASAASVDPSPGTKVLYISPLKALAVDVERNLRSPLVGITRVAQASGRPTAAVTVGIRSGDTPSSERRALAKEPPDILITTPESLYLMLTSAVRDTLRDVHTVIIDEIHAVAGTKRGAHLAVSLERLDALLPKPAQRIGLSATVRPHDEVARFLGGRAPVTVVAPASGKKLDIRVVVPVDDLTQIPGRQAGDPREGSAARAVSGSSGFTGGDASGRVSSSSSGSGSAAGSGAEGAPGSIWPHVEEDVLRRILEQRSTIVFANSRGLAEKLTARLNELYAEWTSPDGGDGGGAGAGGDPEAPPPATRTPAVVGSTGSQTSGAPPVLAKAHHGSVSKEQRAIIEDELKTGVLRCVVATSSLELGIDMGLVDLVIQVSAPPSVASGLQRIGRAGHQVGEVSRGLIYPKSRQDLIGAAVESERMTQGLIERISVPANPLDILAQQTVAAVALEPVQVEDWFETVRRSAPFTTLPRSAFEATLDLLAGRYPSDEFAELRPRVLWDRETGTLTGRPGAQRLAVTSGGTIPDRGMFGVYLAGDESGRGGTRVGELDEEMVYESRINDVFALGATSWRIQQITHDRVVVVPAFGQPGRLPFWHGDGPGRPAELGEALGAFVRELSGAAADAAVERCAAAGLDDKATANLLRFLGDQKAATGHVPSDRTLVLERFRDELGDWRLVLHSPYGMQVNAPWALAVSARVAERYGVDGSCVAGDDGVVARLPDTEAEPPGAELFLFEPDELDQLVTAEVGGSALFAARFRECAARALLLPRYNPGKRAPLWQQRQRSAQLLDVARKYPTFPILLETARECLQDVYDLPALTGLAARIADRRVRVVEVATEQASPFAQSMLFGYVAAFLYEGDSPLAERRAAALTLDSALLSELLGRAELRELLDPDVIARTEAELQLLAEDRKATGLEGTADLLRRLGPLTTAEVAARLTSDAETFPHQTSAEAEAFLAALVADRRALQVPVAGAPHWVAIEDAGRLRDALGTPLPVGIPEAFLTPSADPLADLLSRYARTHGPFTTAEAAARFGLGAAVAAEVLRRLAADGRLSEGEFRPSASGSEWIEPSVLRRLRSRSLAALRKQVEPVDTPAFGRFLPEWQGVGGGLRGVDGVYSVLEQLAGVPAPASAWESLILPARVADYSPAMLDELTVSGEVLWAGAGTLPGNDGWVRLLPSALASTALPPLDQALVPGAGPDDAPITAADADLDELERRVLDTLAGGGGYFFRQLSDAVGSTTDTALTTALWNLAWAGRITGDTVAPLRSLVGAKGAHRTVAPAPRAREFRGGLGGGLRVGRTRPLRPSGLPTTSGGPLVAGRWSILPTAESDPTVRAHANAEALLDRYGVVTRGSVMTEGSPGGFAAAYRVLGGIEEAGRCLRGYFIETLGAAQFGTSASIDRLRSFAASDAADSGAGIASEAAGSSHGPRTTITLAATDPANPYGAALPWPVATGPGASGSVSSGPGALGAGAPGLDGIGDRARTHRPGRKAGAMVVLVDGRLTLFIERGGKRVLTFGATPDTFTAAAESLVAAAKRGKLGRITVESIDGEFAMGAPLADALLAAGFVVTPKGVRLHA